MVQAITVVVLQEALVDLVATAERPRLVDPATDGVVGRQNRGGVGVADQPIVERRRGIGRAEVATLQARQGLHRLHGEFGDDGPRQAGCRVEAGEDEAPVVVRRVGLRTVGIHEAAHRQEIQVVGRVHRVERPRILHAAVAGGVERSPVPRSDLVAHRHGTAVGDVRRGIGVGGEDFGGFLPELGVGREGRGLEEPL